MIPLTHTGQEEVQGNLLVMLQLMEILMIAFQKLLSLLN